MGSRKRRGEKEEVVSLQNEEGTSRLRGWGHEHREDVGKAVRVQVNLRYDLLSRKFQYLTDERT